jgi:hypothetical protein
MLSGTFGWLASVLFILAVWGRLMIRQGPAAALGGAVLFSFAFPVWLKLNLAGIPLSIQTSVAAVTLLGYALHPRGKILSALTLLDFCMALIFVVHVSADSIAEGFDIALPVRAYGEWVLPYTAGRFAAGSLTELKAIAPWALVVIVVLSLVGGVEFLTDVNLYEVLFGSRPFDALSENAVRFGFSRAFGSAHHPIFFGMTLVVLMPWLVCNWQSAESGRRRILTLLTGLVALLGILSTISRTPVVAVIVFAGLLMSLRYTAMRLPTGILFIAVVAGFVAFPLQVTDTVSRWTGGGDSLRLIEIQGEAAQYSGSRSRLLVYRVYGDAIMKAGPTGFGTKATTGFPLRIPYLLGTAEYKSQMTVVDNAYVLQVLRHGWLGAGCFVLMFITAIGTGLSLYQGRPDQLFSGATACLLTAVAFPALILVWFSYDFGFPVLWTIGCLSGLAAGRNGRMLNKYAAAA